MRNIQYFIRNEYGNMRYRFVMHSDEALFKALTGRYTFTPKDLELIRDLVGGENVKFQRVEDPVLAMHEGLEAAEKAQADRKAATQAAQAHAAARANLFHEVMTYDFSRLHEDKDFDPTE